RGFMTTAVAAIACYLLYILYRNENNKNKAVQNNYGFSYSTFRSIAFLLLFIGGALEIFYQFDSRYPDGEFYILYLLLYTVAYINLLAFFTQKDKLQNDGLFNAAILP